MDDDLATDDSIVRDFIKEEDSKYRSKKTEKKKNNKSKKPNTLLLTLFFVCGGIIALLFVGSIFFTISGNQLKEDACNDEDNFLFDFYDCEPIVVVEEDEKIRTVVATDGVVDVSDIYELAEPGVVAIGITSNGRSSILGSGFVVDSGGYIATNQHVVSQRDTSYFVKFNDSEKLYDVEEIFRDSANDLAVVKVNRDNLVSLKIGDSSALRPGELAVAIGNPLGEFENTVTSGIISGLNRTVSFDSFNNFFRTSTSTYEGVIQTDAAINSGNSGGPLLNVAGEVIGINFSTIPGSENISFAIPSSSLKVRLDEIKKFGTF